MKRFDLCDRTSNFSRSVISLVKEIKIYRVNKSMIEQLVRSATSIGANYYEADSAESQKDFVHKLGISKKEARETTYWLDLLIESNPEEKERLETLKQEAKELFLIFNSIIAKSRISARN